MTFIFTNYTALAQGNSDHAPSKAAGLPVQQLFAAKGGVVSFANATDADRCNPTKSESTVARIYF